MEPMAPPEPTAPTTLATTDPDAFATLSSATPAPTPGQRISRGVGQAGGGLVFIELWQAFGWFGADSWTQDQAMQRWPAVTATAIVVIGALHNLGNWLAERRQLRT
jgi:hypothetical protein